MAATASGLTPSPGAPGGGTCPAAPGGDVDSAPVHVYLYPHLLAALLCEQHDMDDEALAFVAVIFDLDPNLGCDSPRARPPVRRCGTASARDRRGFAGWHWQEQVWGVRVLLGT